MRTVGVKLVADLAKYVREMGKGARVTSDLDDALADVAASGERAEDALAEVADEMSDAARAAQTLDRQIGDLRGSLRSLAIQSAITGDAGIGKQLRQQQAELRRALRSRDLLGDSGGEAAAGFVAQFSAKLGPLLAKAPVSPPLLAAGAAAGVALAPVIAAGITGGVGLGVAGIGAVIAAQDPSVQAAAADLKTTIGQELRGAAAPFVPELRSAIAKGKGLIRELRPELDGLFADSARLVEPLVDGIIGGVRRSVPHLREIVTNAEPVVDVFGEHATSAVDAFTGALADMSQGSQLGAQSLDGLLTSIEGTIAATGKMVGFANEAYGWLGPGLLPWIGSMVNAQSGSEALEESMRQQKIQAYELAESTRKAALSYDQLVEASRRVHDIHLSAAEANLRYRDTLRSATEAADGHKRVSSEEESSLLSLARSTNTLTEGLERSGASTAALTGHSQRTRAEFVRVAEKMGYTKTQAEELANKYLAVPKGVSTSVSAPGLAAATNNARNFLQYAQALDGMVIRVATETSGYVGSGGAAFKRWGGIDYAMARGGAIEAHYVTSPTVLYGERATGGEAFVPRNGDPARSLAILDRAAGWYGAMVTAHAGSTQPAAAGVDPATLARAVRAALAGMSVQLDGRAVGAIQGREAAIYARAGSV